MIQSMTGYGAAEQVEDGVSHALEIRGVNHRYLKLSIKVPEQWQFVEQTIEKVLRGRLARGSVTCALRTRRLDEAGASPLNLEVVQAYVDQLSSVRLPPGVQATVDLGSVAQLPGVSDEPELDEDRRQRICAVVEQLTSQALDALVGMRKDEGQALKAALGECCVAIRAQLAEVAKRAPLVVDEYHARLKSRVATLLQAGGFELQEEGLMREVAIFAERCDINEEITRLSCHLDQFLEMCERGQPVGRTLDFLAQEMLREGNTVASKSNDATIAHSVVEIKGWIDRLKEQAQNVE